MKLSILLILIITVLSVCIQSKSIRFNEIDDTTIRASPPPFKPAEPIPGNVYRTMYILDTNEGTLINSTLINIYNAYRDPRLKNTLQILLVAFGQGYNVYLNSNSEYRPMLESLYESGVQFALCNNTINAFHLEPSQLFQYVHPVPSGNGEIIIRLGEGWTSVHP